MTAPAALTDRLGEELRLAGSGLSPVEPLSERHPELDVTDAYEIQDVQLRAQLAAGRVIVGRKVGLTAKPMQVQLGIDSPDSGYVLDDMVYADDALIPMSRFISPRVEPEFAFVLATDLAGPGVTAATAAAALASVHAAIEIIDSRVIDWRIRLVDTVADNASCGAIVVAAAPLDVDVTALGDVACTLIIDAQAVSVGLGNAVMGDPLEPLAWLANSLAERGESLRAGQTILPGAFVAAHPVVSGTTASADFGALGTLTITFTD